MSIIVKSYFDVPWRKLIILFKSSILITWYSYLPFYTLKERKKENIVPMHEHLTMSKTSIYLFHYLVIFISSNILYTYTLAHFLIKWIKRNNEVSNLLKKMCVIFGQNFLLKYCLNRFQMIVCLLFKI